MNGKEIEDFFHSAVDYCSLIETFDANLDSNKLKTLLSALVDIYSKALYLPEVEPENDEVTDFEIPAPQINFNKYDHYWEVFSPYHLNEPVGASLSDDILDIYRDIKKGMLLYEKNEHIEAIWEWKFGFKIHWGSHAVSAIRALHSVNFI